MIRRIVSFSLHQPLVVVLAVLVFIGGGLIFVRRDAVRGLTTAATVWTAAAVGTAAGGGMPVLAVAGGVAANRTIRAALEAVADSAGVRFLAPPLALCTDNAAMIAWAGIERFRLGHRDGMELSARPRWPLDGRAAPMLGAGKRGAKA